MTNKAKIGPLAFQLEVEFLDRLTEPVRDKKAESVSAIIRAALEAYDFTNLVVIRPAQVLISVRLPVEIRRVLKKTARGKNTSVGQLVRSAVEAYLPKLEEATSGSGSAGRKPGAKRAASPRRPAQPVARKSGGQPAAARNMTKKRKG